MTGKNIKKSWNLEEVLNANLKYDGKCYQKDMILKYDAMTNKIEHLLICLASLVTLIIQLLFFELIYLVTY